MNAVSTAEAITVFCRQLKEIHHIMGYFFGLGLVDEKMSGSRLEWYFGASQRHSEMCSGGCHWSGILNLGKKTESILKKYASYIGLTVGPTV